MDQTTLLKLYNEFLGEYNQEDMDAIWKNQSVLFRHFWSNRVGSKDNGELYDSEIDEIVRILDKNAKGSTKNTQAVARAMIAQGAWRRMFNEIKRDKQLFNAMDSIFRESAPEEKTKKINLLYELNKGRKNNLTGMSGNAINAFLVAYDPFSNSSVISLKDRYKLIEYFQFGNLEGYKNKSIGEQIVITNEAIIKGFELLKIYGSARTISVFCYYPPIKQVWKIEADTIPTEIEPGESNEIDIVDSASASDKQLFYMEKQLEDFIIENWDKSEFGRKYELIEENGELVSQQYPTDIGKIDILAKEKSTDQYVVIELKRDQSSDDTVGQIARYMGWIEEHRSEGKPTKGIIITGKYDKKLKYAMRKLKDIEVFMYKVDFKLDKFKE